MYFVKLAIKTISLFLCQTMESLLIICVLIRVKVSDCTVVLAHKSP